MPERHLRPVPYEMDDELEERALAASYDEGLTAVVRTIIKGEGEVANGDYPLIVTLICKEYGLDTPTATEVFDRCEERVMKELQYGQA